MQTNQQGDTVVELFSSDVQYQIPRYQRRYVWDETNWRTLWEDILYQLGLEPIEDTGQGVTFKQREQREDTSDLELGDEERRHFTGPFVTHPIPTKRGELIRFEIIDGQQRLATFQIILCIIRDICLSQDSDELKESADEVNDLIVNPAPAIKRSTSDRFPDPTYKFRPTDYDRPAFEVVTAREYGKLISRAFNEEENRLQPELVKEVRSQLLNEFKEGGNSILDAYDYFYVQIRTYVGADYDCDKVSDLIASIKYSFELVQIRLDSSDQPEKIFESLNATGRMLSEFDYLRNNLFLRTGKLGKDKSGRSYSDIFYDKYWIFENDSQYWGTGRLESFFRAFLRAKVGPYCFQSDEGSEKDRKTFEVYQKQYYTKVKDKGVEYEFQELKEYAKSYKEMHDSTSLLNRRMQFYNDLHLIFDGLNPMSLYPLMLFIKNEVELSDCKLTQIFDILESYVLRRQLRQGINEDKTTYTKINALLDDTIQGKINIKEPRIVAEYLSDSDRRGRDWLENQDVMNGLRSVGRQRYYIHSSYVQRLTRNMLGYILYRIECWKIGRWNQENMPNTPKKVIFHIENFLRRDQVELPLYEQLLMPSSKFKRHDPKDLYSLGNLTYCTKHLPRDLLFSEKKEILSQSPNADIILNKEICEKYNTWGPRQIAEREGDLLDCFYKIWPPAEHFTGEASKPKVEPKAKSPTIQISKSKVKPQAEPHWVSIIQSDEYQFVTYAGAEKLSGIKTRGNQVIGVDHDNNEQTLEKSNILFVCSATTWPELEPHIQIRPKVRREYLQSPKYSNERLDLADQLLRSAQNKQFLVFPVTRYGHELEGTIEDFDTDIIYMQIREHTVIVYRGGIYEFATDEWNQGAVTQFDKAQGSGAILSNESVRYYVHINEVLDKNIRELEPRQKVEFNINQTIKSLVASNVKLVEK